MLCLLALCCFLQLQRCCCTWKSPRPAPARRLDPCASCCCWAPCTARSCPLSPAKGPWGIRLPAAVLHAEGGDLLFGFHTRWLVALWLVSAMSCEKQKPLNLLSTVANLNLLFDPFPCLMVGLLQAPEGQKFKKTGGHKWQLEHGDAGGSTVWQPARGTDGTVAHPSLWSVSVTCARSRYQKGES